MLFGVFSGSRQPLLAVRRHQTDGQAGLVHHIGHAALSGAALQPAQLGILAAKLGQPALQIGVEGVDTGGVLRLVPVDDGFFLILRQLRHTDPPHNRCFPLPNAGGAWRCNTRPSPHGADDKSRCTSFLPSPFPSSGPAPASDVWPEGQRSGRSAISAVSPCCGDWDRQSRTALSFPGYSIS